MGQNTVEMLPRVRQCYRHNDQGRSEAKGKIELNSALHPDPLVAQIGVSGCAQGENDASGADSIEYRQRYADHREEDRELFGLREVGPLGHERWAASTTLVRSMARVMGPTPPGFGAK